MIVPEKHLLASLMFASKARAFPNRDLWVKIVEIRIRFFRRLTHVPFKQTLKFRQDRKYLRMTNVLAYFTSNQ